MISFIYITRMLYLAFISTESSSQDLMHKFSFGSVETFHNVFSNNDTFMHINVTGMNCL